MQQKISSLLNRSLFWFGLLAIGLYWYSIHPPGFGRGYSEDMCTDIVRQMMSEHLDHWGSPKFWTDKFMAPGGASVPFMSWSIERDWLGALFWKWSRDFPFLWAYFGFSLLVSYLGVGFILRKMQLSKAAAWGIATLVVVVHVPRHFKIWHHYEHLLEHWIYWSVFLDAWIWQRFWREKKFSWTLEIWRGVFMLGVLGTTGYFWGPMIFEWLIVRGFLVASFLRLRGTKIKFELGVRSALLPSVLVVGLLWIDVQWFLPLFDEIRGLGDIWQPLGWFGHLLYFLRPLWAEHFVAGVNAILQMVHVHLVWKINAIDSPETVSTIGYLFWIPVVLGVWFSRRKKGGEGLVFLAPFLMIGAFGILFASHLLPEFMYRVIQQIIPFMKYFRVATRWSLIMPAVFGVLIALSWSRLVFVAKSAWQERGGMRFLLLCFAALSILECTWLAFPVNALPEMAPQFKGLLEKVRETPGTTVLDLPFCVAGGNGVCTGEQCPNYPTSTAGMCMREWHDKKVYGLYQSRMTEAHCQGYRKWPFHSWFNAWREQRCFSDYEWTDFCQYLSQHSELSAIFVYPDVWTGAGKPECMQKFVENLGEPLGQASYMAAPTRGGRGAHPSRLLWFKAQCGRQR